MTKHSNGPWKWEGEFNFTNGGGRIITDAEGNAVAHVLPVADRKRGAPYDAPDAGRDANARLIAMAPELFAAAYAAITGNMLMEQPKEPYVVIPESAYHALTAAVRAIIPPKPADDDAT